MSHTASRTACKYTGAARAYTLAAPVYALVTGAAHNGREHGARGVVAGKSGLAHAGAVVDHDGLDLFVAHGCWWWLVGGLLVGWLEGGEKKEAKR